MTGDGQKEQGIIQNAFAHIFDHIAKSEQNMKCVLLCYKFNDIHFFSLVNFQVLGACFLYGNLQ